MTSTGLLNCLIAILDNVTLLVIYTLSDIFYLLGGYNQDGMSPIVLTGLLDTVWSPVEVEFTTRYHTK